MRRTPILLTQLTPPEMGKIHLQFDEMMKNKDIKGTDNWTTTIGKNYLRDKYTDWVMGLADWRIFLTLTFRDSKHYDVSINYWKKLVQVLNKDLLGNNYTRKVGHSYFSYVLGIEKQLRGDYHFHAIIDKPLNFRLLHDYWSEACGFLKTEIIRKKDLAIPYITKYLCKGGVLEPYKCNKDYTPTLTPYWWKFDIIQDFLPNTID